MGRPARAPDPLLSAPTSPRSGCSTWPSGEPTRILPAAGSDDTAAHFAGPWKRDNSALLLHQRPRRRVPRADALDARRRAASRRITAPHQGRRQRRQRSATTAALLAVRAKVDGRDELRLFDTAAFNELPSPALPRGQRHAARSSIRACRCSPSRSTGSKGAEPDRHASVPAERHARRRGRGRTRRRASTPRASPSSRSSAGRASTAARSPASPHLPPARFAGRRPVLINIHGGPGGAGAEFGFLGRANYFVDELGVAVIQPNVRGSAGYGKTFLTLDNGSKREDSVKDIGALLDWIASQPRARPEPRRRLRRQLRRLHEPGGGDDTTPTASPARSTSSASRTSSPSSRTPRATGATCAASSTATSAIRRCAPSSTASRR